MDLPSTPFSAKSRALQPKAQMPVLLNAIMRPPHIEQPALPYPWGKHLANKVKGGIKTRRKTAGLRPQAEATTSRYTSSSSNRVNPVSALWSCSEALENSVPRFCTGGPFDATYFTIHLVASVP